MTSTTHTTPHRTSDALTLLSSPSRREFFLDWLRIAAFALLVPYHVGMYYVTWDFHVKSPFASHALEPWMLLSSPWRMSLLFIVSGVATSVMLGRKGDDNSRGGNGFMRSRSAKLLLPLVCGMVLIVPPQSYFEVVQKYGYDGGFIEFLRLYFGHDTGFCRNGQCLMLPTWNHLWFLPYLWLYTLLLWAATRAWPRLLDVACEPVRQALSGAGLLLVPIMFVALIRMTLQSRFASTHALFGDWFNHAMYFAMFIGGAVFARMPDIWDRFARMRRVGLSVGLAGWVLLVLVGQEVDPALRQAIVACLQWGALMAAIGFARVHLDFDHPWRKVLTEAVFPFYILHQTVLILLTRALAPLHWRPAFEGPAIVLGTFALSLAGYLLVRRVGLLRPWFGLSSTRSWRARRGVDARALS